MAVPRVFISSTCFDLSEIRDGLVSFCENFGFGVALSERGDVFYHPDLHTHESCVSETATCQLFVLIIGGRFGGEYLSDRTKSITNAEYSAARAQNCPVFAFIKQDVLNDHNVWKKNKAKAFAQQIDYPSIEKQEHADDIFQFIDSVRLSPTNNGFFGFRYGREVEGYLRKQWAGMMFDHLQKRLVSKQLAIANDAMANLSLVSGKIEELLKGIYRSVDAADADNAIRDVERESKAEEFLAFVARRAEDREFISSTELEELASDLPANWWEFIANAIYFHVIEDVERDRKALVYINKETITFMPPIRPDEIKEMSSVESSYEIFAALPVAVRRKLLLRYVFVPPGKGSESEDAIS